MKALALSAALLVAALRPAPGHALWSCVDKEGRLHNCDSPSRCLRHHKDCAPVGEVPQECREPRCRYVGEKAPAPGRAEDSGAKTAPPPKAVPPRSPPQPAAKKPAAPPPEAGEIKAVELVTGLLRKLRAQGSGNAVRSRKTAPATSSGLSPAEEQRLFSNDAGVRVSSPEQEALERLPAPLRQEIVSELKSRAEIREEWRKRLDGHAGGASGPEGELRSAMVGLLREAERQARESGQNVEDVRPLKSEEAFPTDPE